MFSSQTRFWYFLIFPSHKKTLFLSLKNTILFSFYIKLGDRPEVVCDYYYYYYYSFFFYSLEFFTPALADGLSPDLSDSKSLQVSRTLLSILAILNNAVVWMVSTRRPTSKSSSPFKTHFCYCTKSTNHNWYNCNLQVLNF